MIDLSYVILLVALFKLKHFLADYPLQGKYMLGKFKESGWIKPLAAHCLVHALFTFCIGVAVVWHRDGPLNLGLPFYCAWMDFWIHLIMDRVKASPYMMGRWSALSKNEYPEVAKRLNSENEHVRWISRQQIKHNTYFWWALGFDQMVHGLTDLLIVYILLR